MNWYKDIIAHREIWGWHSALLLADTSGAEQWPMGGEDGRQQWQQGKDGGSLWVSRVLSSVICSVSWVTRQLPAIPSIRNVFVVPEVQPSQRCAIACDPGRTQVLTCSLLQKKEKWQAWLCLEGLCCPYCRGKGFTSQSGKLSQCRLHLRALIPVISS